MSVRCAITLKLRNELLSNLVFMVYIEICRIDLISVCIGVI
jgi:hypothetical protein